ncbi:hypothetical protein [Falsiroseomonas sp. CW058]|uniref:hypothetical protein n=1 Tax=Falsiroseomonas sp. CW058 TaxID=3388664 RepID=UPI003D31F5AA
MGRLALAVFLAFAGSLVFYGEAMGVLTAPLNGPPIDRSVGRVMTLAGLGVAGIGVWLAHSAQQGRARTPAIFASYAWILSTLLDLLMPGRDVGIVNLVLYTAAIGGTAWFALRAAWIGSPSAREWLRRRLDA